MHDIIQNEHAIQEIHQVIHNTMVKKHIRNDQKGRHSDCLVYVLSGSTKYTFSDGRCFTVFSKDVLYLAKHSLYCMDILTDVYEVIYVDFDFAGDQKRASDIFPMPKSENIELLFQKLIRKWILQTPSHKCECFIMLYTIYASLIQYFSMPYLPASSKKQIAPALDYISENYTNPEINIHTLSEISGISEGHFRRMFKNMFSVSPNQYIRNLRIQYARQLLQYGTQNIATIAELTGFQNAFYFCKVFKAQTGMTPSEFAEKGKRIG